MRKRVCAILRAEFRYAGPVAEIPKLTDVRMLRGIAHPMRNRILEEMSAGGPMRAADVAERMGIPANQASFHLRQLAKYGLVEAAPELARDGRDRVWRVVHESGLSVNLEELAVKEGGQAAIRVFRQRWTAEAHAAIDRADRPDRQKDATVAVSIHAVRLTKAEARVLAEEINDLVDSWRKKKQNTSGRTYEVLWVVQPAPDLES
jgi:predicted ArsR family transcriptional regulator